MHKANKKLRICLVNPKLEGPYPPLGVGYIASYLRKYGKYSYIIKIVDGNCCQDVLKEICAFRPNLIGFTALSPQIKEAIDLSHQIRNWDRDIFQIIGGIHISAMPEETLSTGSFNAGVIGEGEQTFSELVDSFAEERLSKDILEKIKGVCFKDNGIIYFSLPRDEIMDLDLIPSPARDLFDMEHYLSYSLLIRGITGSRITTVMGSRGCPFNCTFCSSKIIFKGVRQFSSGYIIAEIKDLIKQYNIKAIFFTDDTFTINKERIKKFCNLLIEEGLSNKIKWDVQGRTNLITWDDLELLKLMKRAGCVQIDYGFETGSQRILDMLKKKGVTIEDNKRAMQITKKAGLHVMGTFMLGNPSETESDLEETKDFILSNLNNIDYFQALISTPYPGTELYDICLKGGIIKGSYLEQIDEDNLKRDKPVVYSDSIGRDKVIETLKYLNKIAAKKISITDKMKWLAINIFKNPSRIVNAIKLHYF